MKFALVSFTTTTMSLTTSSLTGILDLVGQFTADAASSTFVAPIPHSRSGWNAHRRPRRSLPPDVLRLVG